MAEPKSEFRNRKGQFTGTNPWTKRFTGSPYQTSKTHCPHGHPYAGDNLITVHRVRRWRGKEYEYTARLCRACIAETQRRHRAKKKLGRI